MLNFWKNKVILKFNFFIIIDKEETMLRHRRRTTQHNKYGIDVDEDFSNLKDMFASNIQQHKELKIELQRLRLENKLNQQIRRFIDKRLNQLNNKTKSEK